MNQLPEVQKALELIARLENCLPNYDRARPLFR